MKRRMSIREWGSSVWDVISQKEFMDMYDIWLFVLCKKGPEHDGRFIIAL